MGFTSGRSSAFSSSSTVKTTTEPFVAKEVNVYNTEKNKPVDDKEFDTKEVIAFSTEQLQPLDKEPFKQAEVPVYNIDKNSGELSAPFKIKEFLEYIQTEGCVFTLEEQLAILKKYTSEFLLENLTAAQIEGLQCDLTPYLEELDNQLGILME